MKGFSKKNINFLTLKNSLTCVTIDFDGTFYIVNVRHRRSSLRSWSLLSRDVFDSIDDAEGFVFENYAYILIPFKRVIYEGTKLFVYR